MGSMAKKSTNNMANVLNYSHNFCVWLSFCDGFYGCEFFFWNTTRTGLEGFKFFFSSPIQTLQLVGALSYRSRSEKRNSTFRTSNSTCWKNVLKLPIIDLRQAGLDGTASQIRNKNKNIYIIFGSKCRNFLSPAFPRKIPIASFWKIFSFFPENCKNLVTPLYLPRAKKKKKKKKNSIGKKPMGKTPVGRLQEKYVCTCSIVLLLRRLQEKLCMYCTYSIVLLLRRLQEDYVCTYMQYCAPST